MPLPHKKNFLRDVLPKSSGDSSGIKKLKDENDVIYHKVAEQTLDYESKNIKGRWRIWALVVISIFSLTGAVFYVFSSAEVVIIPRVAEADFNNDFKAKKYNGSTFSETTLGYNIYHVEKLGTKNLDADGDKLVQRKSSGIIIIYNKFSDSTQKLIKNTRFETPDGLIYRIDQSVVIPGRTTVSGKITPGSVEAKVYGDEPGVKYNIGMSNFTIPGFKSDAARYVGFYAVSKTPMLDGFSGSAKYVSDAKQKLTRAEIRSELEKQILEEAKVTLTKDSFIPNGSYTIEFETQPSVDTAGEKVSLKEKASVSIYSFKVFEFDQFLASNSNFKSSLGSSTVLILNRDSIGFTWLSRPKTDSSEISFKINGDVRFRWIFDIKKITESLAGKKRGELQNVLKNWSGIVSATASLSPFWRASFPGDPEKIKVVIKLPEN